MNNFENLDFIVSENVEDQFLELKFNNIDIWPLIRIKLGAIQQNKKVGKDIFVNSSKKISSVRFFIDVLRIVPTLYEKKYLSFSSAISRYGEKDKKSYAPNFDSFLEEIGSEKFLNIEYGSYQPRSYLDMIRRFDVLSRIIQKLIRVGFYKKHVKLLETTLDEFVQRYGLQKYRVDLMKFIMTAYVLSTVWKMIFRLFPFKAVYCSSYANYFGFSLAIACKELKIPFVDLQHGLQGNAHYAYRAFSKHSQLQYNTLPLYFLCWRQLDADYLNSWLEKAGKALVIGLPSCRYIPEDRFFNEVRKNNKVFFFSVSRNDDYSSIESLIKHYPDLIWLIRLHPSLKHLAPAWENNLREKNKNAAGIYVQVASAMSLIQCLMYGDLHFTFFSSVAIEAEMLGRKTIFLAPESKDMFPELYKSKAAYLINEVEDIFSVVNSVENVIRRIDLIEIDRLITSQ